MFLIQRDVLLSDVVPWTWKENASLAEIRDWPEYVCKDPAKLHDRGRILHHKKQIYFIKSLIDPGTDKSR